ncbi:MAG: efflux RND transporter permease subunit, partial [Alphaproteobacteria bacterium]|nr:efflux RND transporter permease subunit [Alphaproteobacteria bacterium]
GNKPYSELKSVASTITQALYESGMILGVRSEIRGDTEDFTVTIIRDVASSLNIEPATIAETIDSLIRGKKANSFKRENKLYDVKVEVENRSRQTPHDITNLFVKAGDKDGTLVPLSELVRVHSRSGPIEIHHHNRTRAIAMTAALKPSYSLGDGVKKVSEIAAEVMPSDMRLDYIEDTKRFLTEGRTVQLVFGLALCFIYLVMAAQFESWRDPFIIILSVPLSLAGAVLTLSLISGGSLNLYSNIGLITLIGLITKHGILIVDFANKLRVSGKSLQEAIVEASRLRLRPILMTTFAMVLGALPLALATCRRFIRISPRKGEWRIVRARKLHKPPTIFNRRLREHRKKRYFPRNHEYLCDLYEELAERLNARLSLAPRNFPVCWQIGYDQGAFRRGFQPNNDSIFIQSESILAPFVFEKQTNNLNLVCDEDYLPIAHSNIDLIVTIFSLHWINDVPGFLTQCSMALKPGGLFLAVFIGGDSLYELKTVFQQVDAEFHNGIGARFSPLIHAKDAGTLLQRAGFACPVSDTDRVTIQYPNVARLLMDIRNSASANALHQMDAPPLSRQYLDRVEHVYRDLFSHPDGGIIATLDIVYMQGWKDRPYITESLT